MAPRTNSPSPGEYVSEGTRLLLIAMQERNLSQEQLRAQMKKAVGVVGRWMRGQRRPDTDARVWLFEQFGIPLGAWDQKPAQPFEPNPALPQTG